MNTIEIVSVLVATAAVFGWLSVRVFKIPTTIGTMLLTVITSLMLANAGRIMPGVPVEESRHAPVHIEHWRIARRTFDRAGIIDPAGPGTLVDSGSNIYGGRVFDHRSRRIDGLVHAA